ncbi:uncharacterized protein At5g02240 isoform X2 [Selaginella moellendorffii]|uniref:uncharacterized protein At5g02240 isoform X2 n=1 Tax=Selaginella moellendorffii TaxID=88036 RepID=UPI000D1CE01F|nr:uncharacterized protein At5g02240 isoform X2 [Selaginella moellendorffii]|eukprot:XP_024530162.1 uncharacterized protein At5g02240 isoform X2 [Selaginella moellendorffii]
MVAFASISWTRLKAGHILPVSSRLRQNLLSPVKVAVPTVCMEKGNKSISFGDKLLDYIEGGPKMRKWYGAPDVQSTEFAGTCVFWLRNGLSDLYRQAEEKKEDDNQEEEEEEEEEGVRDAVLVTDADSETGQLVVLSLIVQRCRVRVLVRDVKLATNAFGSYVEPIVGTVNDRGSLIKACKEVRAIICPKKLGALAENDKKMLKGVEHIVYVSELASSRAARGLQSLLRSGSAQDALRDEAALAKLGVPYTILRPAMLRDEPGGVRGFRVRRVDQLEDSSGIEGMMSREDAALLCVKALDARPQQALVLEIANVDAQARDVEAVFGG